MELRQLQYFMAVCQELHFTRAAEKLGIAQPSLSQQIKLLEHEIGTPLFDRIGKKTVITEAGEALLQHSRNVFHEISQAHEAISGLQGLNRGSLKIGALLTVVNYLLPPTVITFNQNYPNIKLSVLGMRTGDIYEGLLQNELDIGIVGLPVDHAELQIIPLYKQKLALAVSIDSPLANLPTASLHLLKEAASILLPGNYFIRQLIDDHCRRLDFTPQPVIEMTTMESILNMVSKGIGITILPCSYLQYVANPHIRIIPVEAPELTIQIGAVYRKDRHMSAACRVFIDQLTADVEQQNFD